MIHILARRRAKLPLAGPNEPDMLVKHTKKVQSGIYLPRQLNNLSNKHT